MNIIKKKISLISVAIITFFLFITEILAKDTKFIYSQENISNYFSGVVSLDQNLNSTSFNYLKKVQSISNTHQNFNVKFIRLLVILEKFDQAFAFSKSVWNKNEFFFEADLLLGLNAYIKGDYKNAEKYFLRLNNISKYNILFDDFFGNLLISWVKASQNNKEESFEFLDRIPERFENFKKIQNSFLQCYFNEPKTENAFKEVILNKDYSFSRYNFFLANYHLHKNQNKEAKILINKSKKLDESNLLIKQTEIFISSGDIKKVKNLFDCQNPLDPIAEIFYVIANLYSTQENYRLSNFYLKISLFLNEKFTPNNILLAENFYKQKKYKNSKKIYNSLKNIGSIYSWYGARSVAIILSNTENKEL